jgi:predicted nucleotide-binding protein
MADEPSANPDRVFVVHGRNQQAADSMFAFLRALGLKPIEWDQAVAMTGKGSPYVGEVLDVAFREGQAFIVLLTPDDISYLHTDYASGENDPETDPKGQARPNVLFEAGMALGRNEERTILVELGDVRPFSDVGGRHVLRMDNSPQKRQALASRLETAKAAVDRIGSQWLTAGDFTPPRPGGGLPSASDFSRATGGGHTLMEVGTMVGRGMTS